MLILDKKNQNQLKGSEELSFNDKTTGFVISDFWKWSSSDILSNATRGILAEFIVGSAIGIDFNKIRNEWDSYDLLSPEGIKIEVKSAAYIQSWKQEKYSNISFSIKPTFSLDDDKKQQDEAPIRHSDIYVFCLLKEKDQQKINPLKLEQWDFYIIKTVELNRVFGEQKSVRLSSLQKLIEPKSYNQIREEVKAIY